MGGTSSAESKKKKVSRNENSTEGFQAYDEQRTEGNLSSERQRLTCKRCGKMGKETKARTLCFECHELLCETCSNTHLRSHESKSHNLIELVPYIKSTSVYKQFPSIHSASALGLEEELASDFLDTLTYTENVVSFKGAQVAVDYDLASDFIENITLTDETVLYRAAQVPVESKLSLPQGQVDDRKIKATNEYDFSLRRDDDTEKVLVSGVVCLPDHIVIVDSKNDQLKLYDVNGVFLYSVELPVYTTGITKVHDIAFVTCGLATKIFIWNVCEQKIEITETSYSVDHEVDSIHYNDIYFAVLHRHVNALSILDSHGKKVRKFILKTAFKKKINFEPGIYIDRDTNNIFVSCSDEDGVVCLSIEGKALWFTNIPSPWGLTDINGIICVVSWKNNCLHLLSKKGAILRKLLDGTLDGRPRHICFGNKDHLYISFSHQGDKNDRLSVYKLHY